MTEELDLVGVAEIAEMVGVSRQRINRIVETHDEFPQPVAELSAGRIWRRQDVAAWMAESGRAGSQG